MTTSPHLTPVNVLPTTTPSSSRHPQSILPSQSLPMSSKSTSQDRSTSFSSHVWPPPPWLMSTNLSLSIVFSSPSSNDTRNPIRITLSMKCSIIWLIKVSSKSDMSLKAFSSSAPKNPSMFLGMATPKVSPN